MGRPAPVLKPELDRFVYWLMNESDWDVVALNTHAYLSTEYIKSRPTEGEVLAAWRNRHVSEKERDEAVRTLQNIERTVK